MLATITDMQFDNKPYSVTLVPLYRSDSSTPITIIVPAKQSDFVRTKFAYGDTIKYNLDENDEPVLSDPPSMNKTSKRNYDNMLVETMKDMVDTHNHIYTKVQLFGKKFGYPIIKMYTNAHNIRPGDEVLVCKTDNNDFAIVRNFSIEERRKNFLNKSR